MYDDFRAERVIQKMRTAITVALEDVERLLARRPNKMLLSVPDVAVVRAHLHDPAALAAAWVIASVAAEEDEYLMALLRDATVQLVAAAVKGRPPWYREH